MVKSEQNLIASMSLIAATREAVPILDYRHRLLHEGAYANARLEVFPGFEKLTVSNRSVFKAHTDDVKKKRTGSISKPQNPDSETQARSINRARNMVFNIAMLNDFRYFVTWTLDPKKIERENPEVVSKELKRFLHEKARTHGMKYLVIPEYHKDSKGIHLHGLIDCDMPLSPSGRHTADGRMIYNMPSWTYGWSTCIEITGDRLHVAKYIAKYICKDFKMIFGNFYYAGGGLNRKPPAEYFNVDYDTVEAKEYVVPAIGARFKYVSIEGGVVS